jgi:drug/metabolite transporter (DMT)-like permease
VWLMPLAEATAIGFTQPMLTALLAVPLLGERLKPAAIAATVLAFAGVVVVLRPNFAEIGLAALLPLLSALGMAVLVIANRASAGVANALAMQTYIAITASALLVAATLAGHLSGIERFAVHWPPLHVLVRCVIIACSATLAHWLIFTATLRAGAATIAPMTYGQLLAAVLFGWAFFGELPDAVAMIGAGMIIAAGLWLWHLGRTQAVSAAPDSSVPMP